jgi:peptidoglycan/LPS O-acetylase OafA/YrhL
MTFTYVKGALQESEMDRKRFIVEFTISMVAYVVALVTSMWLLRSGEITGIWQTAIALMPMVPGAGVALACMRQVRSSDELQRRIQLEALSLAFGGTALITFSYGFLENVGYPKLSMFVVWPLMAVLWIIGGLISGRRFR